MLSGRWPMRIEAIVREEAEEGLDSGRQVAVPDCISMGAVGRAQRDALRLRQKVVSGRGIRVGGISSSREGSESPVAVAR